MKYINAMTKMKPEQIVELIRQNVEIITQKELDVMTDGYINPEELKVLALRENEDGKFLMIETYHTEEEVIRLFSPEAWYENMLDCNLPISKEYFLKEFIEMFFEEDSIMITDEAFLSLEELIEKTFRLIENPEQAQAKIKEMKLVKEWAAERAEEEERETERKLWGNW